MSYETGMSSEEKKETKELKKEEMKAKRMAAFGTPDRKGKGRED